jgi:RimJ/RimL family protein N-acetyltransferase
VEKLYQTWGEGEKVLHLAVVLHKTQALIGCATCDQGWDPHSPSVYVVIDPEHSRQGFGSETLDLLLRHLFDSTPAHNVSCWIAEWNQAGRLFAKRHGFTEGGAMRRAGMRHGAFFDVVVADLLRPEWQAARKEVTDAS